MTIQKLSDIVESLTTLKKNVKRQKGTRKKKKVNKIGT